MDSLWMSIFVHDVWDVFSKRIRFYSTFWQSPQLILKILPERTLKMDPDIRFVCEHCESVFKKEEDYDCHVEEEHLEIQCNLCSEMTIGNLEKHLTEKHPSVCYVCSKRIQQDEKEFSDFIHLNCCEEIEDEKTAKSLYDLCSSGVSELFHVPYLPGLVFYYKK